MACTGRLHYAQDMKRFLLFCICLLCGNASAVICKSIGSDGEVSYSDVAIGDCGQRVDLPEYSRYAPRPVKAIKPPAATATAADRAVGAGAAYRQLVILKPESGGVVRSNSGTVEVRISTDPAKAPEHTVRYTVDGQVLQGEFDTLGAELTNLERGGHTLQVSIIGANGRVLIATEMIRFTLRQQLKQQEEEDDRGDPAARPLDTVKPPGDQNANNSDVPVKPAVPTPPPGATPGSTNPAYAPNFKPAFIPGG